MNGPFVVSLCLLHSVITRPIPRHSPNLVALKISRRSPAGRSSDAVFGCRQHHARPNGRTNEQAMFHVVRFMQRLQANILIQFTCYHLKFYSSAASCRGRCYQNCLGPRNIYPWWTKQAPAGSKIGARGLFKIAHAERQSS